MEKVVVPSHYRKPLVVALQDVNKCKCSQAEKEPILTKLTTAENEVCRFCHVLPTL